VASLSIAGVAAALQASAAIVRRSRASWLALDAARNVLEHAWAVPCGAGYWCPPPLRCELTRAPAAAGIVRLTVAVTSPELPAPLRLDTLARAADCSAS
jgi:hypothetical protein